MTFPLPSGPVVTMPTLQMKEKLNMEIEAKPILKNNFSEIFKLLKKILSTAVASNPPVSCTKSITISVLRPSSILATMMLVIILVFQVMKTLQTLALTTTSSSLTTSTYLRVSVVSCRTFFIEMMLSYLHYLKYCVNNSLNSDFLHHGEEVKSRIIFLICHLQAS